jgi:hypothetical protein
MNPGDLLFDSYTKEYLGMVLNTQNIFFVVYLSSCDGKTREVAYQHVKAMNGNGFNFRFSR